MAPPGGKRPPGATEAQRVVLLTGVGKARERGVNIWESRGRQTQTKASRQERGREGGASKGMAGGGAETGRRRST